MELQQQITVIIVTLVTLIWYIRPLYNYMAIRKYVLLDHENLSVKRRLQSGLPALIFYVLVFGLLFYPATTNQLLKLSTLGSVFTTQILFIFILSRYDKHQTKYKVYDNNIQFRKRNINFNDDFTLKYKKTFLVVLHKPRFILKSKDTTIVIPVLSKNITTFIKTLDQFNHEKGEYCFSLYNNIRNYYIENRDLVKKINK